MKLVPILVSVLLATVLSDTLLAQQWVRYALPDSMDNAKTIQFLDTSNGMVCSERAFAITRDGGETWRRYPYPTNRRFLGGKLLSDSTAQLVLTEGDWPWNYPEPELYGVQLEDGTWQTLVTIPTMIYGAKIKYPKTMTSNIAHLIGLDRRDGPYIWRLDGSLQMYDSSALPLYPAPVDVMKYGEVSFVDDSIGYAAGATAVISDLTPYGGILKTTDGGKTWRSDTLIAEAGFHRTDFSDSLRGYVGGESTDLTFNYSDGCSPRISAIRRMEGSHGEAVDGGPTKSNEVFSSMIPHFFT